MLAAAAVRFYRLSDRGLWIDELTSLRDAQDLISVRKPHFLSFWLIRQSLRFGDSPFWIRLPSALFGVAGVPAFAWMLRRWFGPAVGVLGAILMAVNPYHQYFSSEARYYAEMIFLASLSLGAWPSLLPKPAPWALAVFLASSLAAFCIHPASTVLFAVQCAVLLVLWVRAWKRSTLERRRGAAQRGLGLGARTAIGGALALAALAVWLVGPFVWRTVRSSNLAALASGEPLSLVGNVGWNTRFIFFPFAFGTVYSNNPMPWLPAMVAALALTGWAGAWLRRPQLAWLALLVWLGTLLAAWSFQTSMPFSSKYAAYAFPLYLGLAAYGLERLPTLLGRAWPRLQSVRARRVVLGAAAAAVVAVHLPMVLYCCRGELIGYKKALQRIADCTEGPQKVYTHTQGVHIMRYYMPRLGLDRIEPVDIRQMSQERSVGMAEATLKRDLVRGLRPWMATHIELDDPLSMRVRDSLKGYFEPVATIPTIAGSSRNVNVWRARPPEAYVALGETVERRPVALPFEESLWLLDSSLCQIAARGPDAEQIRLAVGEAFLAAVSESHDEKQWRAQLNEGPAQLRFFREPPGPAEGLRLTFAPVNDGGALRVPLYAYETLSPLHDGWDYGFVKGRRAFILRRNSSLGYSIQIPREGAYRLSVTALHDAPDVLIEGAMDNRPFGVMAWLGADERFETRSLDFATSAGAHRLQLNFLSDQYGIPDGTARNSDAILSGLEIKPIETRERGAGSQNFLANAALAVFPRRFYEDFARCAKPGVKNCLWRSTGDAKPIESPDIPPGELRLEIPAAARGHNLLSAQFPVKPGLWVYGSFELRTLALRNHSANLFVLWFPAGRSQPSLQYLYATGLYRTTGWTRMPYLIQVPSDAAAVALGLAVYANSDRPETYPGQVWARNAWGPGMED